MALSCAKGVPHVARLIDRIEDPETALPRGAVGADACSSRPCRLLDEQIAVLDARSRAGPRPTRSPGG